MIFKAIDADLEPRFDRGQHPDGDENNCRDHVDNFRRQALCKAITEVHGGRIGHHHTQGRAQNHGQYVRVLCRQGDGCKLRFVAHLRQKNATTVAKNTPICCFGTATSSSSNLSGTKIHNPIAMNAAAITQFSTSGRIKLDNHAPKAPAIA